MPSVKQTSSPVQSVELVAPNTKNIGDVLSVSSALLQSMVTTAVVAVAVHKMIRRGSIASLSRFRLLGLLVLVYIGCTV